MELDALTADVHTYNAQLRAHSYHQNISHMTKIFNDMKSRHVQPDLNTYTGFIATFLSQGNHAQAMEYYREMKKLGIVPEKNIFRLFASYHTFNRRIKGGQMFNPIKPKKNRKERKAILAKRSHFDSLQKQEDIEEEISKQEQGEIEEEQEAAALEKEQQRQEGKENEEEEEDDVETAKKNKQSLLTIKFSDGGFATGEDLIREMMNVSPNVSREEIETIVSRIQITNAERESYQRFRTEAVFKKQKKN